MSITAKIYLNIKKKLNNDTKYKNATDIITYAKIIPKSNPIEILKNFALVSVIKNEEPKTLNINKMHGEIPTIKPEIMTKARLISSIF